MLQLNARFFLGAASELRMMQALIPHVIADRSRPIGLDDRDIFIEHAEKIIDCIQAIGARSAFRSAERLKAELGTSGSLPTYQRVSDGLGDIESRFADHLDDIVLLVVPAGPAGLFGDASMVVGSEDIVLSFPSATFDIEEAAKCLALSRPTAAVFHAMRILEIGLAALSRHLCIPDPSKNDRSWGSILKAIRGRLDEIWPAKQRVVGSKGAELESLFATLDAAKNPWRNQTMHVEGVYTEADAQHIVSCSFKFMEKLAALCNEYGDPKPFEITHEADDLLAHASPNEGL